ncbi:MAG TPA: sorbosone dehydrogenase family protein [Tepidisphaeraceae bacterium]|nr:sorbosone dehydrogenase family protein [Tepidisphaeraceae bacterium]
MRENISHTRLGVLLAVTLLFAGVGAAMAEDNGPLLTGQGAMGDWQKDAPGVRRRITVQDLPEPYATRSIDNGPKLVKRPAGALPKVPPGFVVEEFVSGLHNPRLMRTAPNGDVFLAESQPGRIRILRMKDGANTPELNDVFASGLSLPFGIAFYPPGNDPQYLYVAQTDAVVRFPYHSGDVKASRKPQKLCDLPGGGRLRGGGHWTRDVTFSPDGKKMFVSVGSLTNDLENRTEPVPNRANVLECNPDGSGMQVFALGVRNAVGIAVEPQTGELWGSVNERDGLGDNLVPDYITHFRRGGFYGWPWGYMGGHLDPTHHGAHADMKDKIITPDVILQSHSASLEMTFYTGTQFPQRYRNNIFAAEHGSWNRAVRTGYKVIMVPLENGRASGVYEDFMTGFVTSNADVWGRPVGVTVAHDGSLLVSDDGGNRIWRVSYQGH